MVEIGRHARNFLRCSVPEDDIRYLRKWNYLECESSEAAWKAPGASNDARSNSVGGFEHHEEVPYVRVCVRRSQRALLARVGAGGGFEQPECNDQKRQQEEAPSSSLPQKGKEIDCQHGEQQHQVVFARTGAGLLGGLSETLGAFPQGFLRLGAPAV